MDGTLRIWDVILARQIDAIHVDVSVTSLFLSPNMDVLATTHVDQNGIYLWVNQAMFSAPSKTGSYGSGNEIVSVHLPSVSTGTSLDSDFDEAKENAHEAEEAPQFLVGHQQIPDLVTLSLLPKSQWQSLINLDIIKARNKPNDPPKKPEKAPFFLPSIPSLSGDIVFKPKESAEGEKDSEAGETDKTIKKAEILASQFLQFLESSAEENNYAAFTDCIKGLTSSTLDMELRMLQIIDDEEEEQETIKRPELHFIELVLDYFILETSSRNNFEFIQALPRLFLKIHGESIRRQPVLQRKAQKLLQVQSAVWQTIDELFQSTRCMVTFLSNSQF